MSEPVKCKRCNAILTSEESIKRGYGKTCYKIITLQGKKKLRLKLRKLFNTIRHNKQKEPQIQIIQNDSLNTVVIKDILGRMRKLELDNSYLKSRANQMVSISKYVNDPIERIKQEESAKITDPTLQQYRNVFHECITDLKEVLKQGKEYLKRGLDYEPEIESNKVLSLAELKKKHKKTYIDVQKLKLRKTKIEQSTNLDEIDLSHAELLN